MRRHDRLFSLHAGMRGPGQREHSPYPMTTHRSLAWLFLVSGAYLAALLYADSRYPILAGLPAILSAMPVMATLAALSWLLRYARWQWLLHRADNGTLLGHGLLAYLAGFAFTATPGKVGELLRIRYFADLGVPSWRVLAAFVYERGFDLATVLMLSAFAASRTDIFILAAAFVAVCIGAVVLLAYRPALLAHLAEHARQWGLTRLGGLLETLRDGLAGSRLWFTPLDGLVSFGLGLLAWALTSLAFIYLLQVLGVALPSGFALAVYPMAMLAGAASMLPGGIGSTEVAIVALLSAHGVTLATATLAAVGIRLATMWFAIICGFVAIGILEA